MTSAYRFLVADIRTGRAQHELQLDDVSWSEELNKPGAFQASMPVELPAWSRAAEPETAGGYLLTEAGDRLTEAVDPLDPLVLETGSVSGGSVSRSSPLLAADLEPPTAVFVAEKDGQIVWAGPIWTLDYDLEANSLKLAGEGWLSYLRRVSLRTTKVYGAVYQTLIMKDLIDWAQSQLGGDFLIDTDTIVATHPERDRTYYHYERKRIGTLIEQLAAVQAGFDFRFIPRWTAGPNSLITVAVGVTFPATGRRTNTVFELGGNADVLGMTVDGTQLAYQVDAIGRGEGDDLPIVTAARSDQIDRDVLLDDDVNVSDVVDRNVLAGYAARRLSRGQALIKVPRLALDPSMLGEFELGDQVRVRGSHGLFSVDGPYRVTGYEVSLSSSGPSALKVTCAPLVLFDS